jgi:DNA-directed RNA polymerase specialized sigma24 family protein
VLRTLVDRARHGDEQAFGALVGEVGDRCIFIAHRILRDTDLAEDAVQMALVQVWRELPALRDLDRFEAWLHRILVNACYAEARRSRRFAANVVLLETDAPASGDEFLTINDRDQLDRGFRRLPPEQARNPGRGHPEPGHPLADEPALAMLVNDGQVLIAGGP